MNDLKKEDWKIRGTFTDSFWLIVNGTSTQKGQFVPTVGRETGSGG